jgi:uncharacterized protein
MTFEWDPIKAKTNLRKHHVSFAEAATALLDPLSKTALDPDHSISEHRFLTFGLSWRERLLAVSHAEKKDVTRIIRGGWQPNVSERFMKKIRPEMDDWLRPEYKRSDLAELVRGKYAVTEVEFAQLVELILACIGEEENVQFEHHSEGNYLAGHKLGDWTYEMDNANQIKLRYWLSESTSIAEEVTNPTCIMTAQERVELQNSLVDHVRALKTKASAA